MKKKKEDSTKSRRSFLGKLGFGSLIVGLASNVFASEKKFHGQMNPIKNPVWDPYDFGAKGDGKTIDTKAIQTAIDSCYSNGGGKVLLYGGTFVSGTIILKSNVCLHIEAGATLLGSEDLKDYPDINPELLYLYTTP